jgi:3-hydroxybutyryl-CoA dehydrogenase
MEIKTLGVVGAGTVGHGIAQVGVQAGFRVLLRDLDDRILQQARERSTGLGRLLETGDRPRAKTDMLDAR